MTTLKTLFDWISWCFGAAFLLFVFYVLLFPGRPALTTHQPDERRSATRRPRPTTARRTYGSSRRPAFSRQPIVIVRAPDVPDTSAEHEAHVRIARTLIADPDLGITRVWVYECGGDAVGQRLDTHRRPRREAAYRSRASAAALRCRRQ
jgi:hypothetical protein